MNNIKFKKNYRHSISRKVGYGTWKTAGDPSVYSNLDIDMTQALVYIKKLSEQTKLKITPIHLVAKAIALTIQERPEINGMLRLGKISIRDKVSIFFQVNVPGHGSSEKEKIRNAKLAGVVVENVEDIDVKTIAEILSQKAQALRQSKDKAFNQSFKMIEIVPWFLIRFFLNLTSFLIYSLNLDLSKFGLPKDPFGSVMITNVGGLGIDNAWAPLCPYTRVPLLMTVGKISDKVIAENGEPKVRPMMSIGVTFDHRLIDGVHAAHMNKVFKLCFADPEKYFGLIS